MPRLAKTRTLTPPLIKQAKPRPAEYEIADDVVAGFRLLVYPSGKKSFVLRYTLRGKYNKITLGKVGEIDLKTARDRARARKGDVSEGRDPSATTVAGVRADGTLAAAIADYKTRHVAGLREGTIANIERELDALQTECPGAALHDVSRADVIRVIKAAAKRGPSAAVQCWKCVRAFLSWCEGQSETAFVSPAKGVSKPADETRRERTLNDDELRAVWKHGNAMVRLLILSGARRSEIAELERKEIVGDEIVLPSERTKMGKPHSIFITPQMRAILDTLPKSGKYMLNGTDHPPTGYSKMKKALNLKVGFSDWTLHDLRRTFRTGISKKCKVDFVTAEFCIGHKLQGVAAVYDLDTRADNMRTAWQRWADFIEGLAAGDVKAAA